jgi:hypothetical protein
MRSKRGSTPAAYAPLHRITAYCSRWHFRSYQCILPRSFAGGLLPPATATTGAGMRSQPAALGGHDDAWADRRFANMGTTVVAGSIVGFLTFSTELMAPMDAANCSSAPSPSGISVYRSVDRLLTLITVAALLLVLYSSAVLRGAVQRLNNTDCSPAIEGDDCHFIFNISKRTNFLSVSCTVIGITALVARFALPVLACRAAAATRPRTGTH